MKKTYKKVSDKELIKSFKKHGTASGVSRELNVCWFNTRVRLKRLGIVLNKRGNNNRKYTKETLTKMYKRCKGNYTLMSRQFNTTPAGIYMAFKRLGIYNKYPGRGNK